MNRVYYERKFGAAGGDRTLTGHWDPPDSKSGPSANFGTAALVDPEGLEPSTDEVGSRAVTPCRAHVIVGWAV